MKRTILIAGIIAMAAGFIMARVGDSLSMVNRSGVVRESALMPIGAIVFILGMLALAVALVWYLVSFIRGKLKKG